MEVFVEQGQSYEKCLRKIYEKYGDNITIIRKKDAKVSKLFGLLEKDIVEVTFTMNTGVRHVASVFSDSVQSRAYQSLDDQEERMKIVKGYANKNIKKTKIPLLPYAQITTPKEAINNNKCGFLLFWVADIK